MSRTASVTCEECDARVVRGDAHCTGCGVAVTERVRAALDARHRELAEFEDEGANETRERLSPSGFKLRFALAALLLLALVHGALALADANAASDNAKQWLVALEELPADRVVHDAAGTPDTVANFRKSYESFPLEIFVHHLEIAGLLLALLVWGRSAALALPVVALASYFALQVTEWPMGFPILRWFGVLVLFAGARAALELGKRSSAQPPAPVEDPPEKHLECLRCGEDNRPHSRFCAHCGERLSERAPVSLRKRAIPTPSEPVEQPATPDVSALLAPAALAVCVNATVLATSFVLDTTKPDQIALSWLLTSAVVLGWVLVTRRAATPSRPSLGRQVAAVGLGVLALTALVFVQRALASGIHLPEPTLTWLVSKGMSVGSAAVLLLVVASIDELAFRGYVFGALERAGAGRATLLLQAALYAVIWPPAQLWQGFITGLVLGSVRRATGSVSPCIVVQAGAIAAFALLDGAHP
jgi:hypothetical protein